MKPEKKKMPKWAVVVIVIIIICIIGAFTTPTETDNNSNDAENNKYMTKIEWTNRGNDNSDEITEWLKVAVEDDKYDGDILKAGNYNVSQSLGEYEGETQRVYNLYISEINTDNPDNVPIDAIECSIGNYNGANCEINLEKGQYLYIQKVAGNGSGHLLIEKIRNN